MKIYGINELEARRALDQANEEFDGNLRFNREPESFGKRVTGVNLTLRVKDSSGPGAKSGYLGQRTVAANYDAFYAFMERVFMHNPEARISTAMEDYRGIGEFYAKAPAVARRNVGSIMSPRAYGDM